MPDRKFPYDMKYFRETINSYFLLKSEIKKHEICHNAETKLCATCKEPECDYVGLIFEGDYDLKELDKTIENILKSQAERIHILQTKLAIAKEKYRTLKTEGETSK